VAETGQHVIRLARRMDADAIAALSRVRIEHGLSWRWRPARIRRLLNDDRTTIIVSEDEGELTGFAIMSFAESSAHLNLLAVRKQFSGIGVAASLFNWLRESCSVAGIARINLEVRAGNNHAVSFYRQHGFQQVGIQRGYYEGKEDALLMTRQIIPPEIEKQRPA
jgi:ribosomal-protein-alanine acetyltransferase